jgi:hypothetical protein
MVAVTGLTFGLWPALKPEEPPASKGATLRNLTLEKLSFGQYLDRIAQSRSGWHPAQLDRQGALVSVDIEIEGYRNKRLPLRLQLIDSRTGEQVALSRERYVNPEANKDQGSYPIWVPLPRGRGRRFFVQIELLDDRGVVPLRHVRTHTFSGT